MRNKILSLVIPALLIKIEGASYLALIEAIIFSTESESLTLSICPSPLIFRFLNRSDIFFAPSLEVAVPTTVAPNDPRLFAIAAPIPLLAPVTRAILSSKLIFKILIK